MSFTRRNENLFPSLLARHFLESHSDVKSKCQMVLCHCKKKKKKERGEFIIQNPCFQGETKKTQRSKKKHELYSYYPAITNVTILQSN